jgi:hypothetical protein
VAARTRTPLPAALAVTAVVMALALLFPLAALARATSAVILVVFALVNLSSWRLIGARPDRGGVGPRFPRWVPLSGFVACAAVLALQAWVAATGAWTGG